MYLGVTLDGTLSHKTHVSKPKKKFQFQTNLLNKPANTIWEADPKTLRQAALALCQSTAEYCAPVWTRSRYACKIDAEVNKVYRIITGRPTLKLSPLPTFCGLTGLPPPHIRRKTTTKIERFRQPNNSRRHLFGWQQARKRSKSCKSFATEGDIPQAKLTPSD